GRSNLPDSDDLIHGGPAQTAEITVKCRDGQVTLLDHRLDNGQASVPLNAPIKLEVSDWTVGKLYGRAADGREITLRVEPSATADAALDVAMVIDHSGSMKEQCSAGRRLTKHTAIVRGLQRIASGIGLTDSVELWEFDDEYDCVGSTKNGDS